MSNILSSKLFYIILECYLTPLGNSSGKMFNPVLHLSKIDQLSTSYKAAVKGSVLSTAKKFNKDILPYSPAEQKEEVKLLDSDIPILALKKGNTNENTT